MTCNTHFLNAFFVDTHFGVDLFKYFAQGKGEKPDGSQAQLVAHFVQDLAHFLAQGLLGPVGLLGDLGGERSGDVFLKEAAMALSPSPDPHGPMLQKSFM